MVKIEGPIPQEEVTRVLVQALGMLLNEYQITLKVDSYSFDYKGIHYKVGVTEAGQINLERYSGVGPDENKS